MLKNFNVISIPIFLKEYLIRDKDNQLEAIAKNISDILIRQTFNSTKRGYRDIVYTTIEDNNGDRTIANIFFNFILSKTARYNENSEVLYRKELNIDDSIENEVFEVIAVDEFDDKVDLFMLLDNYNPDTHEISFMIINHRD